MRRGGAAARWAVLVAGLPIMLVVSGRAHAAPPPPKFAPPSDPCREAREACERHLRLAREHLAVSCEMLKDRDRHAVDGYYVACQEAWDAVWTCPRDRELLIDASDAYADALAGLLEAARRHGRLGNGGLWVGPQGRPVLVPYKPQALAVAAECIASIEPQAQAGDKRLSRRHLRDGFGLPVVVRVANRSTEDKPRDFAAPRQSLAATAVLRFDVPGHETRLQTFAGHASRDHAAAVLDLANPVEIAAVRVGTANPMLAADLSAPLLDVLDGTPRSSVIGFLQPFASGVSRPHLEMLEPHQPGRIPVVFIHGLASDEGTWFDMLNELRAWPEFHRSFEPWVYHYPTGVGFPQSAAALRAQLRAAVKQCDPRGTDPAMRNLVLVGHSLGGLHAKMQAVSSGDRFWRGIALTPFEEMQLRPQAARVARTSYFFEPQPFVNRVVCIATPHRGSLIASLGIGRLASLTVKPPPELASIHREVVGMNPGRFRPEFERRTPTTIDLLQPDSPLLEAIRDLRPPCWVSVHSVVGVGHASLTGGRDDCVVAAESAHTEGAISEICVPATHTRVHHHPQTIVEVRRILEQHLHETGLAGRQPCGGEADPSGGAGGQRLRRTAITAAATSSRPAGTAGSGTAAMPGGAL